MYQTKLGAPLGMAVMQDVGKTSSEHFDLRDLAMNVKAKVK